MSHTNLNLLEQIILVAAANILDDFEEWYKANQSIDHFEFSAEPEPGKAEQAAHFLLGNAYVTIDATAGGLRFMTEEEIDREYRECLMAQLISDGEAL